MSNEISIAWDQKLANGSLKDAPGQKSVQITQTNQLIYSEVITVTTGDTVITPGNLSSANLGRCEIINLDPTNYVTLGPTASAAIAPFIRLMPNEPQLFRFTPSITFRMQAHTASCQVQIKIYGN